MLLKIWDMTIVICLCQKENKTSENYHNIITVVCFTFPSKNLLSRSPLSIACIKRDKEGQKHKLSLKSLDPILRSIQMIRRFIKLNLTNDLTTVDMLSKYAVLNNRIIIIHLKRWFMLMIQDFLSKNIELMNLIENTIQNHLAQTGTP